MGAKKSFLLILALGICLAGCGSGETSEKGSEPTQVTVQSGLVSFAPVSVEPSELEGTWVDSETGTKVVIGKGGTMTIEKVSEEGYTSEQVEWVVGDDGLIVTDSEGGKLEYKVVEKDGQIQIMGSGSTLVNVKEESVLSQEVNFLGLGESATTDLVKVTLTGIEFAQSVSTERVDYLLPYPNGGISAQPGNLLACVSFRVQNLTETPLEETCFCTMELEYDNAYTFSEGTYGNISSAQQQVPPKTRCDYRAAIECAEMVAQENDISLCIHLTLPDTGGEVHFTYVLK